MGEKPPFASGKLAGDYKPLFEYWRVARERGREDLIEASMLQEADYDFLRKNVVIGESVLDLLEKVTNSVIDRIDPEIAQIAMERVGLQLPKDEARLRIARLLASWLIEAGEYWGYIRLTWSGETSKRGQA